jgi:hypothetical protein
MSKIDLIIDALSISQNSVWSKLNEQALAAARELQAEKQEPVGQLCEEAFGRGQVMWFKKVPEGSLLYTAAPSKREWVGLTDEEIDYIFGLAYADDMELLRTIEAKLKDKNG